MMIADLHSIIPAHAGILGGWMRPDEMPAFAGMTGAWA
jgi:hypothetical protein